MTIIRHMMRKLDNDVQELRDGLDPENLAYWYDVIIAKTIEMAPPWLEDKIKVRRDPILTMKFDLDISRRAVRYFMIAADGCIGQMPYSTRLYFLKVQEVMEAEMDKSLV